MTASSTLRHACARALVAASALGGLLPAASAQASDPTVLHSDGGLTVRWHLQAGLNAVAEQSLFWNLAATTSPGSGYDPDKAWLEAYVKPSLSFERSLAQGGAFYGKL